MLSKYLLVQLLARLAPALLGLTLLLPANALAQSSGPETSHLGQIISKLLADHPGKSGAYVLEKGEESLLARAWLSERAQQTIDVQYFIWSTDNVGTLAAEALLQAAQRGVRVRVIVDDLLVDAAEETLLALDAHPEVEIRIYNPKHSVGVSGLKRAINLFRDFRSFNQRMHDKTFMVDGAVAITGGRNMADEYFDFDHDYNFRDRDVLLLGPVVTEMHRSFEAFWQSPLSVPVSVLLGKRRPPLLPQRIDKVYAELHAYAADPSNFAPEVRRALADLPRRFPTLLAGLRWQRIRFLSDEPGKNPGESGLGGGGRTTRALLESLDGAQQRITIQSPYLVLPEGGIDLLRQLVERGIEVSISTNSLASTDNLQAFSGYHKQRSELLAAGVKVFEFRPNPAVQRQLIERFDALDKPAPVFAIHAKTLVIDGRTLFIGTFNLDPRSANLNTEVGALIDDSDLAVGVEKAIRRDMLPENSWSAAKEDPDSHASWSKRLQLQVWKLLPLDPLL